MNNSQGNYIKNMGYKMNSSTNKPQYLVNKRLRFLSIKRTKELQYYTFPINFKRYGISASKFTA